MNRTAVVLGATVAVLIVAAPCLASGLDRVRSLVEQVAAAHGSGGDSRERDNARTRLSRELGQVLRARQEEAIARFADELGRQGKEALTNGRYEEAESFQLQDMELRRVWTRAVDPHLTKHRQIELGLVAALQRLGDLYRRLGSYSRAEQFLEQARELRQPPDATRLLILLSLAEVYREQGRLDQAERNLEEALQIARGIPRQEDPNRPLYMLSASMQRGLVSYDQGFRRATAAEKQESWQQAEAYYQEALAAVAAPHFANHPGRAQCLNNLGRLYHIWWRNVPEGPGKPADLVRRSHRHFEDALQILGRNPAAARMAILDTQNKLAALHLDDGDLERAQEHIDEAFLVVGEDQRVRREFLYNSHYTRGRIAWARAASERARGDRAAAERARQRALNDLVVCKNLALEQRGLAAGTPFELARYFSQMRGAFERMVHWRMEQEQPAEAFRAMERARARSLMDQMLTAGLDLLAGLPDEKAQRLRNREREVRRKKSRLREQLERDDRQARDLMAALNEARQEYHAADAAIRRASPAYQLAIAADLEPIAFDRLLEYVRQEQALLLQYMLGIENTYVLVIPAGNAPRLEKLELDDRQAQRLGVDPGPLSGEQMRELLLGEDQHKPGLIRLLGQRDPPDEAVHPATDSLAALWEVLIPEPEREAIVDQRYQRLLVVPDAALAQFPFEALVVQTNPPWYLLEAGPPIIYAPSASLLLNLAERQQERRQPAPEPVLSIGQCTRLRPLECGTAFGPLAFDGPEIAALRDAFQKQDIQVRTLRGEDAREAMVRAHAPGRSVLHFATHGYVGEQDGSLFGKLLLTPGPRLDDPADDGFLRLDEVYEIDLAGCELVILSACVTHAGPALVDEGVWALSRGFLVAGARRVVATTWDVHDLATAVTVQDFARHVAGGVDHAEALQRAKRRVFKQDGWRSPYYWAPFVLIGPR